MTQPQNIAKAMIISPRMQVAAYRALRAKIVAEAEAAWTVALTMLGNTQTPARTRWDIAKTLLAIAGHVAPKAREAPSDDDSPLAERSTSDLKALVTRLEGELAERATPLSATVGASILGQAIEAQDYF